VSAAWHRVRQFFGALVPRVTPADRAEAYAYLSSTERALFETMTLRDQQHGIIVMRRVRRDAGDDALLCTAALIHDCGKGRVAVWHRVAHVLLGVAPRLRERVARADGASWRRAMWRLLCHPQLGSGLAAEAGAHPEVVRMIREQDAAAPDARLAILQAADEA
jgi:hypothetical protein